MRLVCLPLLLACTPQPLTRATVEAALCEAQESCGSVCEPTPGACAYDEAAAPSCLEALATARCDGEEVVLPAACEAVYTCPEAPGWEGFVPTSVAAATVFAYDAGRMEATGYVDGESAFPPILTVILFDAQWTGAAEETEHHCVVTLTTPATALPTTGSDLFGAAFSPVQLVEDGCAGVVDPEVYADVGGTLAAAAWSFGIREAVSTAYAQRLVDDGVYTITEMDGLLGGVYGGDVGFSEDVVVVGARTDPFGGLIRDQEGATVPLSREQMVVDGVLQDGFYRVSGNLPFEGLHSLF